MLQIIRIYYDIKSRQEYEQFLFNYIIRNLLEKGDVRLIKNLTQYQGKRYLKFIDDRDLEIEVICKPLSETAVTGVKADIVYIQQSALYKTNSNILNEIPTIFHYTNPLIYVFDNTGVIGTWNID